MSNVQLIKFDGIDKNRLIAQQDEQRAFAVDYLYAKMIEFFFFLNSIVENSR